MRKHFSGWPACCVGTGAKGRIKCFANHRSPRDERDREREERGGEGKRRCLFAEAAYDLNFAPAAAAKDGRTRTRAQALEMVLKPKFLAHPALAAAPLSSLSLRPLTRLIYLPSLSSLSPPSNHWTSCGA